MKALQNKSWYRSLISDCKSLEVEKRFESAWLLIEIMHGVGKRIIEEEKRIEKAGMKITELVTRVSVDLEKSERSIWRAVKLYRKYPDLSKLPLGKNITVRKVVALLEDPSGEVCKHKETEKVIFYRCKKCGTKIEK